MKTSRERLMRNHFLIVLAVLLVLIAGPAGAWTSNEGPRDFVTGGGFLVHNGGHADVGRRADPGWQYPAPQGEPLDHAAAGVHLPGHEQPISDADAHADPDSNADAHAASVVHDPHRGERSIRDLHRNVGLHIPQ